jgi:hypothetical protein
MVLAVFWNLPGAAAACASLPATAATVATAATALPINAERRDWLIAWSDIMFCL